MRKIIAQINPKYRHLPTWFAALAIVLCSTAGNLYWLHHNVVLVGRDSGSHLERTLKVANILSEFSVQSIFQALTFHDYRPPLLYIAAQPFYWFGEYSMDQAQLLNVTLSATILLLTLILGLHLTNRRTALFAMLLTALLPMIPAMARLFYMESLLTTMLLLNFLALFQCRGFTNRAGSICWGITLGLALLVKWTAPIYILLLVAYVLWSQPSDSTPHKLQKTHFLYALFSAILIVLAWYWPNRMFVDEFLLGETLPMFWMPLVTLLLYLLMQPANRRTNFWTGILLALTLASVWYLPRIDFLPHLTYVAFDTDRGNQEALNLLRLTNYTRYFRFWVSEHMGLLPTVLIIPFAIWTWGTQLWSRFRKGYSDKLRMAGEHQKMLPLWLILTSAYLFLIVLAQANPRNLVPLIPIVALLLADALSRYSRPVALPVGIIWVAVLMLQWSIYTFDAMAGFYQKAPSLWVSGDYLAWPATGSTDPGYWIQPDVLSTIEIPKDEPASLGMLVDMWEVHRGSFRYPIAAGRLDIELQSLTEPKGKGWGDMLSNRWILIKDGDNSGVRGPGLSVVNRILNGDPLFHLLYDEVKQYPLPNGETIFLYHRTAGPAHPHELPVILIETSVIADHINAWWSDDATLYLSNGNLATWVGIHDLFAQRIRMPQSNNDSLEDLLGDVRGTILVATRYDTSEVQRWLRNNSYYAGEVGEGEFKLTLFGRPPKPLVSLTVENSWPEVQVIALDSYGALKPGQVLPIEMSLAGRVDSSLKISLRLVDPSGASVAQQDKILSEKISVGLFLPPRSLAGEPALLGQYSFSAVIYDPQTLTPITDLTGNQQVELATITVSSEE